jgi:uncharacterized protein (TIGR03067 family)
MFRAKTLVVGLAAAFLAVIGPVAAEDSQKDKEKLQGEWRVVSIKLGGLDHPKKDEVGERMTFQGDTMSLAPFKAEFKLDASKDPREVDFTLTEVPDANEKGKRCLAIYKFDGDRLIIHSSRPEGERPAEFESKEGQTSMVFTLERVKK